MARFLIDANLPYRFALWQGEDYLHVYDLGDDMPDAAIWQYAKEHDLIIVSKDAPFAPSPLRLSSHLATTSFRQDHGFSLVEEFVRVRNFSNLLASEAADSSPRWVSTSRPLAS